uniref:Putative secreted peptide n=1 Tax=Anopheles braziliensis TaxID=58242 RepID=A0A2M3ZUS6_9DIPT
MNSSARWLSSRIASIWALLPLATSIWPRWWTRRRGCAKICSNGAYRMRNGKRSSFLRTMLDNVRSAKRLASYRR